MLEANSVGRAAPKTKTINVEANLLAERISERERVRERVTRRLVGIAAVCLLSLLCLPTLFTLKSEAAKQVGADRTQLAIVSRQLSESQNLQESVRPMLAEQDLATKVHSYASAFIGQNLAVMNSASAALAFSTMKTDVLSGEIRTTITGEAESSTAIHEFVKAVERAPHTKSANLKSQRLSAVLSQHGASFDFERKAVVPQ